MHPATILDIVRSSANRHGEGLAILAPGRLNCSYDLLGRAVEEAVSTMARWGLEPDDRVAVVLPNGPEMATAFLAVSAAATCAPLNPAYREQEFEFYLRDLRSAALILTLGEPSPARAAAERLGIPILECRVPREAPAGCFELVTPGTSPRSAAARAAAASDVALVLHTSGTTARPKQVPLTHANLCASAGSIAGTFNLGPDDRCLNVLPLFHIHGLVAAVLSTVTSGGSIVATPGFLATHVFDWIEEFAPTWFTAVPAMHQALAARAQQLDVKPPIGGMRFVRSSSAPLPAGVVAELETLFGAPVIDAYGMTEAAHQMASNPLPPAARKPGSVGRAAGSDVAVMDARGRFVESGVTGEVVVRGANVTAGYDGNPEANQAAFTDGWFRTGDQGRLDSDGYLFLTGRLKEVINRGGEKIAPREIDEVFGAHPAVLHAAAFAVSDTRLGEEIGVAVVLRDGQQVLPHDLLAFAAGRLSDFKLPRHLVFVAELPKGPTGKLQRIGLAERLGVGGDTDASTVRPTGRIPSTEHERIVAGLFADILKLDQVCADDSFFRLGGDSLLAVALSSRLEEATGVEIPTYFLLTHDTPEALAAHIDRNPARLDLAPSPQPGASAADAPLTIQQEFHCTIETLLRGAPLNHRPGAIRLTGPLDAAALRLAIDDVVSRHAPLRSVVSLRGARPRLAVAPTASCPLCVEDLSSLPPDAQQVTLREGGRRFALQGFDLTSGPLLKVTLVRLSDTRHVLLVNVHHMVFDGWSMGVFVSDLAASYEARVRGTGAALPTLSASYADHAVREREALDSGRLDASLEYWRTRLSALPEPFSPAPRGLRSERPTGLGRELRAAIDPDLAARVAATGQTRAATPFMTHLAVFGAFCRLLGAPDDLVLGAFVSRRSTPRLTPLIGCFYNLLPIRLDLSGDPTFPDLVDRARQTITAALTHQDVPYGHLLRRLRPRGGRFFDVAFQYRNFPPSTAAGGAVQFEDIPFDWGLAQWDLLVEVTPHAIGHDVRFAYSWREGNRDLGAQWADAFRQALEWAGDGVRPLSVLGAPAPQIGVPR